MRWIIATCLVFAIAACEETTAAVDRVGKQSAKSTVSKVLATRFPSVPQSAVTPFSDCVIDNASLQEIREFAKDAVAGIDEATVILVSTILERPGTQQCIARAGLAALAQT
ncbi:MAG: hypothetical protein AAF729_13420 [Pseudomonadota bacterium]